MRRVKRIISAAVAVMLLGNSFSGSVSALGAENAGLGETTAVIEEVSDSGSTLDAETASVEEPEEQETVSDSQNENEETYDEQDADGSELDNQDYDREENTEESTEPEESVENPVQEESAALTEDTAETELTDNKAEEESEPEESVENPVQEENAASTEDAAETELTDNKGEEESEPVPTFDHAYDFGGSLDGIDFSSCRIFAAASDPSVFTWDTTVLSEYNGIYLLSFPSEEETANAYTYYYNICDFVEADAPIVGIAADTDTSAEDEAQSEEVIPESADLTNVNENDDAISALNTLSESAGGYSDKIIALIDTGASENGSVIERVSVIGDNANDDNGHGDEMVRYILEEDEDALIMSIKALDASGTGHVSDLYAGIEYAIASNADIINLSVSAFMTEGSEVIEQAVQDAADAGIVVVGAAGNNGKNAAYYIPGRIDSVIVAGACDENGNKLSSSNYGDSVDYNVVAGSTSEAAARLSGFVYKNGTEGITGALNKGLIFECGYDGKEALKEEAEDKKPEEEKKDNAAEDGKVRTAAGTIVQTGSKDTVSWDLYDDGKLVIRPTSGAEGTVNNLGGADPAFAGIKSSVTSVEVQGTVHLTGSAEGLFKDLSSCQSMDLTGFETSNVTNMAGMFNNCKATDLGDLSGWNTSNVTDMSYMFNNCKATDLGDLSNWNTSKVTDMDSMFEYCDVASLNLSGWDTSNVTDMSYMFNKCKATDLGILSGWNTSNVTDMHAMFNSCKATDLGDLSSWDTSKVTDMRGMFCYCNVASLDLSGWDTSKVANMNNMFNNCKATDLGDLSSWDTSKVTDMCYMFYYCKATNLDLSNWNTSNVTNMLYMFYECAATDLGDLSNWNTSSVTNMCSMFGNCKATNLGDLSNWNTSNVTDMQYMFSYCAATNLGDLSNWDTSKVTDMSYMFNYCKATDLGDLSNWNTSKVADMSYMFRGCQDTDLGDLSNWNTSKVTNMCWMFRGCQDTDLGDLSNWNTSSVTDMSGMFYECAATDLGDISNWDTSKVTDMHSMFYSCKATDLDLSNLDTSNVANMSYMFYECAATDLGDLSNWNTSKVTNMHSMFDSCKATDLGDLSNWNTSKVTDMDSMFESCDVASLNLSGWDTSNVTNMRGMFHYCKATDLGDLSSWDTSKVTDMGWMFDDCAVTSLNLSGWDTSNVTGRSNMLSTKKLEKLVLGNDTHINESGLGGNFIRKSTGELMTANEVMNLSTGNDMADTYYRARDIMFNGAGGTPSQQTVPGYVGMQFDESGITVPAKKGSDFAGWYTEKSGGEELKDGDEMMQTAYFAHWNDHSYTLVLKENAGEKRETEVSLTYNQLYRLRNDVFDRDGFVITSWNTKKDGSGTSYAAGDNILRLTDEDGGTAILYAQWEDARRTITFNAQGGSSVPDKTAEMDKAVGTLPSSEREGFGLVGWFTEAEGGEQVTKDTVVTGDMTLYAHWVKDPVITFEGNGGVPVPMTHQKRVRYNQKISYLPGGWNHNMELIGWFTEPEGGEQVSEDTVLTEDITLYAHWGYVPVFNTNGGKITQMPEYELQESPEYTFNKLPAAERDGYDLAGWFTPDGRQINEGDTLDLSQGRELTARWTPSNTCRITLNPNGGTVYDENGNAVSNPYITAFTNKPLPELPIPQKTDSVFEGWYDSNGTRYTKDSAIDGDIALTARWSDKSVTVTFDGNGGKYQNNNTRTIKVPSGGLIQDIPGFIYTGKILEGWYTQPDGQGTRLTKDTVINEDVTYYANWIPELIEKTSDNLAYSYAASWENASNVNADNAEDNLNFHPTDATTQTATLHVRFELSNAIQGRTLPVGTVRIRIPKSVFEDWDGAPAGTNNLSKNLPEFPNTRAGMVFSYIDDGDSYILTNNTEMGGGTGVDASISYQVSPWIVNGGAIDSNGHYVEGIPYYQKTFPITFTVDEDNDGTAELEETRDLSIEFHTKVGSKQTKGFNKIYYAWDESWGEAPADADNCFFIKWSLSEDTTGKGTNQPYKYIWDEDNAVHDGTVVYSAGAYQMPQDEYFSIAFSQGAYVVTKHPVSLLENIPDEGLKIHNEAIVTELWKSGYETPHRVKADYILHDGPTPVGEFDKRIVNHDVNSNHFINGGQEDILDDNKEITLDYELIYNGDSRNTPVLWDEEKGTYTANRRIISFVDGVSGDVMYSSGLAPAKHVWEPTTGNVTLEDDDYYFKNIRIYVTEKDSRKIYRAWADPYPNYDDEAYEDVNIYIREKGSDSFTYFTTIRGNDSSVVTFPADTVGFEIRHPSEYYGTELKVVTDLVLKPTSHVRALIQDDVDLGVTSEIKNRAVCDIWNEGETKDDSFFHVTDYTGGNNSAFKELYELNVSNTYLQVYKDAASESNVIFDVERGTQDNPIVLEGRNYNNSSRKKAITSGTFYDLLPAGTTVNENSIFVRTDNMNVSYFNTNAGNYDRYKNSRSNLDRGFYNVSFIENWQGSGRTMMKIDVSVPGSIKATAIDVYYLLHNTYENVVACGTTIENDLAFVDTTPGHVRPYSTSGKLSVITDSQYFAALDQVFSGNIGFAKDNTNYIPVDAFSWMFNKTVKSAADYEKETVVRPGGEYSYRLEYSQSAYASSSKIVFYDVLEAGTNIQDDEWHGTFKDVDLTAIRNTLTADSDTVHCAPVVYYSTKDRDSFTGADYNVTNSATWTTTKPMDSSRITAVAIDCSKAEDGSDFVLSGKQMFCAYITMQAPSDAEYVTKKTANKAVIYTKKPEDDSPQPEESETVIEIEDTEPEIHKTSEPASGTETKPAKVVYDSDLIYTLKITNKDEYFTIKNVVVNDTIPAGLIVDTPNIMVHFGNPDNAMPISSSPRVSMTKILQNMTFTINSLASGEDVYIVIPTTVNKKEGTLINQAKITRVDGREKDIKSEITYHEAVPFEVTIRKLSGNGENLAGARLQIINNKGTVVQDWTTGTNPEVVAIGEGTFKLHEVSAPEDYALAEDITFTVDAEGKVSIGSTIVTSVDMIDYPGTSVSGTKSWVNDEPGERPQSITVELLRDNVKIAETVTNADKEWKYSFDHLQIYKDKEMTQEYVYSVREQSVEGYAPSYSTKASGQLEITFSADCETESTSYDYAYIYYMQDGKLYRLGEYGGNKTNSDSLAGRKIIIPAGDFWLYWHTDGSVNKYGMKIDSIKAVNGKTTDIGAEVTSLPDYSLIEKEGEDYPETAHPYANSDNKLWHYTGRLTGRECNITNTRTYPEYDAVISKTNADGQTIAGAVLRVTGRELDASADITPITWTTEAGKDKTVALKPGTYKLHEVSVPSGGVYLKAADISFTVEKDGTLKVAGSTVDKITMVDEYAPTQIILTKGFINNYRNYTAVFNLELWSEEGGQRIPLANYAFPNTDYITDDQGHVQISITASAQSSNTSSNTSVTLNVPKGTHYRAEETASEDPKVYFAYAYVNSQKFETPVVEGAPAPKDTVSFLNIMYGYVEVEKVDQTGAYMPGAVMQIMDDKGTVVKEWTTTGVKDTIYLKPSIGESCNAPQYYVLHEKTKPENATGLAEDIRFYAYPNTSNNGKAMTVNITQNKLVDTLKMVNTKKPEPFDITISKTDTGGHQIAGAQLKITGRETGETADITPITWTSEEGKDKTVRLRAGTYTLHEEAVPAGGLYLKADDIAFTVDADGTVKIAGTTVEKVVMVDGYNASSLKVKKTVTGNLGDRHRDYNFTITLKDAKNAAYTKAVSYKKGTETGTLTPDASGKVSFTLSHRETIEFTDLLIGTKYEVTEADYRADGYTTTSSNASGTVAKTNPDAEFVNSKGTAVPTGVSNVFPWFTGLVILAGAAYIATIRRRRS